MSSFVVEDKTINRITTYLFLLDREAIYAKNDLAKIGIVTPEELGEQMYRLNLGAVDARYGEGEAMAMCDLAYAYVYELGTMIQAIKSLQCWRYQCAEGTCDQTDLYRIMSDYMHGLALRVVADTKDYELANWG